MNELDWLDNPRVDRVLAGIMAVCEQSRRYREALATAAYDLVTIMAESPNVNGNLHVPEAVIDRIINSIQESLKE